ncbi:hypothetical protein Pelo_17834 [Pelomyxa schiedti]|nr:hypothetical protein Pelo_17834 [Pelomyxa schiedti]
MPWEVRTAALDGEHSLVVSQGFKGPGVMLVDLEATLKQNRLIAGPPPVPSGFKGEGKISSMIGWKGQTTALQGEGEPIGGQYYAVEHRCVCTKLIRDVFSVVDPTVRCCSLSQLWESERMYFKNEFSVRIPDETKDGQQYIEVIDAISGLVLFQMEIRGGYITLV